MYPDDNKEKWPDFLGTVLSFGSCKVWGISGIADEVLASQEVLWSM
jgi:hypothetical protein